MLNRPKPPKKKTKKVEFTSVAPLRVTIELDETTGTGEIQVDARDAAAINNRRHEKLDANGKPDPKAPELPELETTLLDDWKNRRAGNGDQKPHFADHAGHRPILMREGEVVEFNCKYPFEIWADRDPNVSVYPGAPNNPFGWNSPQSASDRVLQATVNAPPLDGNGTPTQPGPADQQFYKFRAWVYVTPDKFYVIDPDGSCDR